MLDTFAEIKSPSVKGFVVWLPMIPSDSRDAAIRLRDESCGFSGTENAKQRQRSASSLFWNGDRSIGKSFRETLSIGCTAWDVYLVYKRGSHWRGAQPPKPDFWMHQLSHPSAAALAPRLNKAVLIKQIRALEDNK